MHIYGEIHKAVYIIICALARILSRWIFYACRSMDDVLYIEVAAFCDLQAGLILFGNTFWCPHHLWAGRWDVFLLCLLIPACLRKQIEVWSIIPRKIYLFSYFHFHRYSSILSSIVSFRNDSGNRIMPFLFILV